MEEKASAPMLRIPSTLMPSYNKATSTEEGKQAQKRVRVNCGVCDKIRYYSVHRGVTRIGGIISCEACRHFYQKFKRQPCVLSCIQGGSCDVLEDNSRNRCRACWVGHILMRCPVPQELYQNFVSHLPKAVQEKLPPESPVLENIPESKRGCLGLEVSLNGKWIDMTVPSQPSADDSGVGQSESFDGTYDGDSSTEASLGHNTGGHDMFNLQNFIKLEEGLNSDDEEHVSHSALRSKRMRIAEETPDTARDLQLGKWMSCVMTSNFVPDTDPLDTNGGLTKEGNTGSVNTNITLAKEANLRPPDTNDALAKDSLSIFGLFVASQLSNIKDPEILENVKFQIQIAIFEGIRDYHSKVKQSDSSGEINVPFRFPSAASVRSPVLSDSSRLPSPTSHSFSAPSTSTDFLYPSSETLPASSSCLSVIIPSPNRQMSTPKKSRSRK